MSEIGHNSTNTAQLRSYVDRIRTLTEEKKGLQEDISEVFKEAKSNGYNVKKLREVIRLLDMEKDARDAEEADRQLYCDALGVFG